MAKGLVNESSLNSMGTAINVLIGAEGTYAPSEMGAAIIDWIRTETASGNPIHITDAAAYPAEECVTTLEPVQDLHGYDKPWPSGGNKNILKDGETSPISAKGFTATMNSDGSWNIGGENTDSFFATMYSNLPINFPAGTYTFSVSCSSDAVINGLQVWIYKKVDGEEEATASRLAIPGDVTITASSSFSITNIAFWHDSANKSFSGKVFMQLEQASSPTAWTPYSNICPISGHTGVELTRTGKNLLAMTAESQTINGVTFTVNLDGTITANGTASADATFILFGANTTNAREMVIDNDMVISLNTSSITGVVWKSNGGTTFVNGVYNIASGVTLYGLAIRVLSGNTINNLTVKPMIRLASDTDPTFKPYTPETHAITFPQAQSPVYGCEVDWTNRVLKVTKVNVDLGTLTWGLTSRGYFAAAVADIKRASSDTELTNIKCSIYKTDTSSNIYYSRTDKVICVAVNASDIWVADSGYSSVSDFKAAMSGVQLVYELATPLEIPLTPQIITLLKGENNVWTDSGESKIEYKVDLQSYIQKRIDEASARASLSVSPMSLGRSAVLASTDGENANEIKDVDEPAEENEEAEGLPIEDVESVDVVEDEPAEAEEPVELPVEEDTEAEPTESEIWVKEPDAEEVIYKPIDVTEPIDEREEGGETD